MTMENGFEEAFSLFSGFEQGWPRHRQRQIVALLIRQSLGSRRARQASFALMERFGSLPAIVAAPIERLMEVPGVGRSTASLFAAISATAVCVARTRIDPQQPVLGSWTQLIDYCHAAMAHDAVEKFRVLFLDRKNRLIADEIQQVGTVDHTPVYPREVIRRSLELSATALILVHNHPSGDPAPSSADVRITKEIAEIAKNMGITLHDHIIIGKSGHASLRGLHLI